MSAPILKCLQNWQTVLYIDLTVRFSNDVSRFNTIPTEIIITYGKQH